MSRRQVLQKEYERNLLSRRELCDKLLRRYLRPDMTVLDFGCGPGFLAKAVSDHVQHVLAVDVSRDVLACAGALNGADNIRYLVNAANDLAAVADASVDLVHEHEGWEVGRVEVRMASFSEAEITGLLQQAGFGDVRIVPVASLCAIDDNIGAEHLVQFQR
ncbi:MAG TPA: class I SAM-dependent methyltransferase [Gemmataceae bacterium]